MRKLTTILMSAVAFGVALTAWAARPMASQNGARTIGGSPDIVSTVPEANSTVAELSELTVVFDQPVKVVGTDVCAVTDSEEWWKTVGEGKFTLDADDPTKGVITFAEPFTEAGSYDVCLPDESILAVNDTEGYYAMGITTIIVDPNAGSSVETPAGALNMTVTGYSDSKGMNVTFTTDGVTEFEDETFPNLNIKFDVMPTVNAEAVMLTSESGAQSIVGLNSNFLVWGEKMVLVNTEEAITEAGTYTLEIPKNTFTDSKGNGNDAAKYNFKYTKPEKPELTDAKLEIASAWYTDGNQWFNLGSTPSIAKMGEGGYFEIETNLNDYIGHMDVALWTPVLDENGNVVTDAEGNVEQDVIRRFYTETGRTTEGNIYIETSGNTKLEKGKTYYIEIQAYDDPNIYPEGRNYFGTDENPIVYTVEGDSEPFRYSDVKIKKISPEPGTEIYDPEQVITIEFTAPVTIDKAKSGRNEGSGYSSDFKNIAPGNAEKTIWLFTIGEDYLNRCKASALLFFLARDLKNNLIVVDENTTLIEEDTRIQLEYECNLNNPAIVVEPGSGKVESLEEFKVCAPRSYDENDNVKTYWNIQLGSGADKPYLTTASGAVVAEVDMDSEVLLDAAGKPLAEDENMKATSAFSTFKLDKKITKPGKYVLVFPYAAFGLGTDFDASSNRSTRVEYIIEGELSIDGATINDGAELSELSLVGFKINSEVELEENAAFQLRNDAGNLATFTAWLGSREGVTYLMADMTTDGKGYQLEPGQEYIIRVPKGRVKLAGTDMYYPQMDIKVKGAEGNATVKLSHSVAEHAAVVAEVSKGKSANVNLAPAKGWKLDKVTFNGKDVTSDVKDNVYTTPALDADAEVVATVAYDGKVFEPASVDEVGTDFNLRAYSENGALYVAGLEEGMVLDLYTVGGAHVGNYVADSSVVMMNVNAGVYIITVTKAGKVQAIKVQNK